MCLSKIDRAQRDLFFDTSRVRSKRDVSLGRDKSVYFIKDANRMYPVKYTLLGLSRPRAGSYLHSAPVRPIVQVLPNTS